MAAAADGLAAPATRYLGPAHLARLFDEGHVSPADCVAAVEASFAEHGRRGVGVLPRQVLPDRADARAPRERALKLSAAYLRQSRTMGASIYSTHYRPGEVDMWLTVFCADSGRMLGVLCGKALSLWKTGATAAVATRHLARSDARRAALIGTGRYALEQLRCLQVVRPLERVSCFSRDRRGLDAFVARARAAMPGLAIEASRDARDAVEAADIVTTVTTSPTPVLAGGWLAPGAHVNAMGQHDPAARELDTDAVRDARVFVDALEQALAEKGELVIPLLAGEIGAEHVSIELGRVVAGLDAGRRDPAERTVFCSGGTAMEYMGLCRLLLDRAERAGIGQSLEP